MRQLSRQLPILFSAGACQSAGTFFSQKTREENSIVPVSRTGYRPLGIEEQAERMVEFAHEQGGPVVFLGHSLGALIAYRAYQLAPTGLVQRTLLVNCGSIGEALPLQVQLPDNPFETFGFLMDIWFRPESAWAVQDALTGRVKIGRRTKELAMVAGDEDKVVPLDCAARTAERTKARFEIVHGDHNLLQREGVRAHCLTWLKTGRGLGKLTQSHARCQ